MKFEELLIKLRMIQNFVDRNWETLSGEEKPISFYQCVYLSTLQEGKELRPHQLAEGMGCEWESSRAFTDKLHALKLIDKRKVSKKCVLLRLSPKGRKAVGKFRKAVAEMASTCIGDLPPQDIETTLRVMTQLLERSQ